MENTKQTVTMSDIIRGDDPVVVEFWAPWCGPCRQMEPHLEAVSEQYADQVRTVRVNADENPDLARDLRILTIPTMIVYHHGEEQARRVGAQSRSDLETVYADAAAGRAISGMNQRNRMFRIAVAVAIVLAGREAGIQWPFFVAAGAVFFSAIHDRCPVWQAIRRVWQKSPA